ncbi:MAG: SET domain-containing protein-lysine N-methyltransferase [Candidatus Lokiarchaeota archaeon]|nr:SET domain-containing protein-lysine N-methyltransferase [Candidatus Lokiarchaeota archaeon]
MHEYIEVKFISEKKGRGAFAKRFIKKGTVIDIANVVLIPNKQYKKIRKTQLYDYCYIWEDPKQFPAFKNAITLSVSQFINHSYDPNLKYLYDYDNRAIEFSAIQDIQKGEELTVNYNGLVDDTSPIWFKVLD